MRFIKNLGYKIGLNLPLILLKTYLADSRD
jgi:hypothetical protein